MVCRQGEKFTIQPKSLMEDIASSLDIFKTAYAFQGSCVMNKEFVLKLSKQLGCLFEKKYTKTEEFDEEVEKTVMPKDNNAYEYSLPLNKVIHQCHKDKVAIYESNN